MESVTFWHSGECRRNAPIGTVGSTGEVWPKWPLVSSVDWCGDYVSAERFSIMEIEKLLRLETVSAGL